MLDKYKKIIENTEDPADIAAELIRDKNFLSGMKSYEKEPYDHDFFKISTDDTFTEEINIPMCFQKKGETIYLVKSGKNNEDHVKIISVLAKSAIEGCITMAHRFDETKGLFLSLMEAAYPQRLGIDITTDSEMEEKEFLFGKCGYSAIITVDASQEDEFVDSMYSNNVEITLLGHVTKGEVRIDDESYGFIKEIFD